MDIPEAMQTTSLTQAGDRLMSEKLEYDLKLRAQRAILDYIKSCDCTFFIQNRAGIGAIIPLKARKLVFSKIYQWSIGVTSVRLDHTPKNNKINGAPQHEAIVESFVVRYCGVTGYRFGGSRHRHPVLW
ncbi:hypothetical protein ABMA57_14875 [Saccharospirillum sp. HFRX-1]|uniref:hypothetical protein n=1 Tax=unclassified Saccharospirillum TaxID=2633430 RepID=UPI00371EF763